MYVKVDLVAAPPAVTLEEPEDTKRFHLAVQGGADEGAVAAALSGAGVGRLEGREHGWIDVDAVRRMAAGRVGESWEGDFRAMVEFARTKGWLDEAGTAIQAHVEWP